VIETKKGESMNSTIRRLAAEADEVAAVHRLALKRPTQAEIEAQPGFQRWMALIGYDLEGRSLRLKPAQQQIRKYREANGR
jgi:hypothetical protein